MGERGKEMLQLGVDVCFALHRVADRGAHEIAIADPQPVDGHSHGTFTQAQASGDFLVGELAPREGGFEFVEYLRLADRGELGPEARQDFLQERMRPAAIVDLFWRDSTGRLTGEL